MHQYSTDQQQLADNLADGMKIRQESSPPTSAGLVYNTHSPSSFAEFQTGANMNNLGSHMVAAATSSPNPGMADVQQAYSLTNLQVRTTFLFLTRRLRKVLERGMGHVSSYIN